MAEKKLLTRIIMNHGEWASYAGKKAKDGEVIYVKVGTTNPDAKGKVSEPIWMQKIGDGVTEVQNLPWVVAPAADVYEWAKKSSLAVADVPTLPISKIEGLEKALSDLNLAVETAKTNASNAVETANSAKETADGVKETLDTFLGSVTPDGSKDIIDTLQEINDYVGEHGAEFAALSAKVTKIEDGTTTVPKASDADTVDGKHADYFATSEQGTKADNAAAAIATYGDIVTHNASDFQVAGNYEAAGAAAQALIDAKKYTDDEIIELDLANTYAAKEHIHTMEEITDLDVGVTKIISNDTTSSTEDDNVSGLKITPAEGTGEVNIEIDDTIVFILNGGDASNLD